MIIKRKLFSKKEENKNSNDTSSKAKGTALYLGGVALGTYAGVAVTNAGMSELARGIAYRKKKKKLEKEKDKKKDDK